MKRLGIGLLALLLTAGSTRAQQCLRPAERTAFDTAGLKSQLMITALTCNLRDKYNAFVLRFRRELLVQEQALHGYFDRSFGRRGQQRHDDYITNLANTQSQAGLRDGAQFCQRRAALFDAVLSLPNGTRLTTYAADLTLVQPMELRDCGGPGRTAQAGR